MAKLLTILGMLVAVLILLLFTLDLALSFPFGQIMSMDLGMIICGVALLYLSWSAFREQT
ncbi:MAG: hypothetical protein IT427_20500 [Pirellulales bacterium]|nr:hypothetical protein [Pirellulales bacterium]